MQGSFFMKKNFALWFIACIVFQLFIVGGVLYAQEETSIDISFYASTLGEMQINFIPQWEFPFLRGKTPLTENNNIALKLDASLSPIFAGLTGDAVLTVAPFLSFTLGAKIGTGWNYDIFGKIFLVGLGLNQKTTADDPNDGVIGKGLDGVVWDVHKGTTVQFDLAAFVPGDWNHIVMQIYSEIQFFAYTNAHGDDLWYYLMDDGMNQNAFRYYFTGFIGYEMPIFLDLVGIQLSETLPFYNTEIGKRVRDIGYSLSTAFIANFKINDRLSIMTIARISNVLKKPITSAYEREWGFDCAQFIATWHIK